MSVIKRLDELQAKSKQLILRQLNALDELELSLVFAFLRGDKQARRELKVVQRTALLLQDRLEDMQ